MRWASTPSPTCGASPTTARVTHMWLTITPALPGAIAASLSKPKSFFSGVSWLDAAVAVLKNLKLSEFGPFFNYTANAASCPAVSQRSAALTTADGRATPSSPLLATRPAAPRPRRREPRRRARSRLPPPPRPEGRRAGKGGGPARSPET